MYTNSIIMMLTWPVLLVISYQIIKLVIKKYEAKQSVEENNQE